MAIVSTFVSDLPFRHSCRGLLVADERILLAERQIHGDSSVWVGPGGGMEAGESLLGALTRELYEETGLHFTEEHAPQLVWIQTVEFPEMRVYGYAGVVDHYVLIDVEQFAPVSGVGVGAAGDPEGEGILDHRWWTISEIEAAQCGGAVLPAGSSGPAAQALQRCAAVVGDRDRSLASRFSSLHDGLRVDVPGLGC
jgi:ADP-ribose pyrophosphatase YjhB (NUDIX family)